MQPTNVSQRTAFSIYLLIILVCAWPLGSNRDWAWPVLTILSALAAVTVSFSSAVVISRYHKLALGAFALLITWMSIQYNGIPGLLDPTTYHFYGTRSDIAKTLLYAGFFYLTVQLVTSHERCRSVVYLVIALGMTQALLGAMQQLMFDLPRSRGSFANPNHFAGYLEVCLTLAIGAMIALHHDNHHRGNTGLIQALTGPLARIRVVIVIMVVALVMSRSRMGNIAFFSSILVTAAIAFYCSRTFNRYTAILLASILAIDVFIISSYFGIEQLGKRFTSVTTEANTRVDLQAFNLRIIKDHTWMGTGAGSYEVAFATYRDATFEKKVTHAENDFTELLIELGVIGIVPMIAILVIGLHAQVRLLGTMVPPFERGIAFGCLAGTISLLIHGTADVNLQIPANSLMFVLLLAIPVALAQARQQPDRS